jgi:hypothetical protein
MSPRKSIHDDFDAVVDFFPPESVPNFVYGLVKVTYQYTERGWRRAKAEPLYHDIRLPDTKPFWAPGSDFWPTKLQTDVAVRGSAHSPNGRPVPFCRVRVQVGQHSKAINVYGDRQVLWNDRGKVQFGSPEPFTELPIVWERSYGGWDRRVPIGIDPMTVADMARLEFDHPGMYPRNPMGRGYLVVDAPCEGVLLPNLEDPLQPLNPATYITRDPALWYRQPLPACFEYTNAMMFHRLCWLGAGAWFHPPAGVKLAEVQAGVLPPDYLSLRGMLVSSPQVLQEGAIGLVFDPLPAATPIIVEGMHPEIPRMEFALPRPPMVDFSIDGKMYPAPTQLTNVLVEPGQMRISLTYAARQEELPRVFIPGIHANIPLALRIDRTQAVPYVCPPTLREQRKAAAEKGAGF